MNIQLNSGPLANLESESNLTVPTSKGRQIMEELLLNQYSSSDNLKEYYMCFIAELDILFEQVHKVYFGRFLENAEGAQLDVIGIILQQSRSVILPTFWFGFQGAINAEGMADETTPSIGGTFKDENLGVGKITPLDDRMYKRMLTAKAAVLNRDTIDISLAYYVIAIILGRVPSVFELRDSESGIAPIGKGRIDLKVLGSAVTEQEVKMVLYMAKYFIPVGMTFTITKV